MKLEQILFEAYSIEEIEISVNEDTSLGEDQKEIWVGATHPKLGSVGHVKIIKVDSSDLDEKYLEDFNSLKKQISNEATLWGVENTWTDRRFRGEGLGQVLYLHGLKYVAENYNGIVVANKAWGGEGSTSDLAMNVWNALARKVKHVGIAYWGGNIQNSDLKLRSRRKHGWEEYRTNKPREKRITDFED